MSEFVELIAQIKQSGNSKFPIVDSSDLLGGYIQVDTLEERNEYLSVKKSYAREGMRCYVKDTDSVYVLKGGKWIASNSDGNGNIIIQAEEPEAQDNTLWVDTSKEDSILSSPSVIQDLLSVIGTLQQKVRKLEYALECHLDSGDFSNNMYTDFEGVESEEPKLGSSEEDDNAEQEEYTKTEVADATEPTEYKDYTPNLKHLSVKHGTYAEMQKYADDFVGAELLWCTDTQSLYIKDPKTYKLIKIGSTTSSDPIIIPETTMDGILTELFGNDTKIVGIEFADMANTSKTYKVSVQNGALNVYDYSLDTATYLPDTNKQVASTGDYYTTLYEPKPSGTSTSKQCPLVYINMVYCGENDGYSPISHNFVELCNLTDYDINLKGLYLHYTENAKGDTRQWITLPLEGLIKSKSTFLIKGSKVSKLPKIKVGTPDMYWTKSLTKNSDVFETDDYSIWSDDLLNFSHTCSFFLSGESEAPEEPWKKDMIVTKGYIDLVGFGMYDNVSMPCEGTAQSTATYDKLFLRYYNMDPVSQAYVAPGSRSNYKDWTYIDLINTNQNINLEDYTPKASSEGKTIFFNKNLLTDGKPVIITCTFGYNAHTTRCFNWVSKGYRDEYLMYKKNSDSEWTTVESFKAGDGRTSKKNWNNSIYNRIRSITTDGTVFTVHKCIIDLPEPDDSETYTYKVGYKDNWTDERTFTLRNRQKVIDSGFNFIQVTDQQGFNAEEYETWRLAAEFINKNESQFDFTINTGDATQNGNRINEWIDYFNAGKELFKDKEQMYTVGNNDLCPLTPYELGDGSDLSKNNPINVQYFFTFEFSSKIPMSNGGVYIPCVYSFIYGNTYFLSMNSEITSTAAASLFNQTGDNIYSDTLKSWCDEDLANATDIKWKIAFCHEAPFTIKTQNDIDSYLNTGGIPRGGSHLNTVGNYWFSHWLEDNEFKLCICGHKHTYSNSRLLKEPDEDSMKVIVYDPEGENASWYQSYSGDLAKYLNLVEVSSDATQNYVKYVMCQATGYKLTSNKELPGRSIPWLLEYYPVTTSATVNKNQQYPNYIKWNVGVGNETETGTQETSRDRILGDSVKLYVNSKSVSDSANWSYKYNNPYSVGDISSYGGNGETNSGNNNIIVEYSLWK